MRFLFPVAFSIVVAVALTLKHRERRLWDRRKLSGGRKALVLNLVDRR